MLVCRYSMHEKKSSESKRIINLEVLLFLMGKVYMLSKANESSMTDIYFIKTLKLAGLQFDHSSIGVNSVSVSFISSAFMLVM